MTMHDTHIKIYTLHTYIHTFKGSFWRTLCRKFQVIVLIPRKKTNKYLYIVTQNKSIAVSSLRHRIGILKTVMFFYSDRMLGYPTIL